MPQAVRAADGPVPLLPTKLFTPVLEPDVVERGRLLESLNMAGSARLLLVSAPAGSGKTTLVAQVVHRLDEPACWVSLDRDDDDPAVFIGYVVDAFQSLNRGLCERTHALARSGAPPAPRVVAMSLIADLAESAASGVLVLDDYHTIAAPAVHELLTLLIERLPPSIVIVVITRSDPPLPLARMRGRGQLREVRETDLRFNLREAGELTGRLCRRPLRPDSLAALTQRTEGWAVGLQLAGLALRQASDPDTFIAEFTGTHTFVADYLTDEVLAGVPEAHQRFLTRTALLTRLTGPLCDAALERTNSQALLDTLSRANLFLVPLDDERRWFRYHHLFADLLRRRGGSADAAERQALLGRAAGWCERNDAVDDAIGYAVRADDITRAAGLVARHGIARLAAGEGATAFRWIRALPHDVVRSSPDHCVIAAWALAVVDTYGPLSTGYALRALEALDAGRREYPYVEDVALHARVIRAGGHEGAPETILRALEETRDDTPEDNLTLRAAAEILIGEIYRQLGHYAPGLAALDRARELGIRAGSTILRLSAVTAGALLRLLQGRLRATVAMVETELSRRTSLRESLGTQAGNLYAIMASAHLERNDLEQAERDLRRAAAAFGAPGDAAGEWFSIVPISRARPDAFHTNVHAVLWGFSTYIRLLIRKGEMDTALRHLDTVEWSMTQAAGPSARVVVDSLRVRVWTACGDRGRLRPWLRSAPSGPSGAACWDNVSRLTRARAALAVGEPAAARALLDPLIAAAARGDHDLSSADALVLNAVAGPATGTGGGQSLRLIEEALALTAPEGRSAPWLEAGTAVVPLLEAAVREGRAPPAAQTHAAELLAMLRDRPVRRAEHGPDALSEREITVLRLLAAGHTNQQIADTLFLAVGSVKKHTHNIFGKLGVTNRTQAAQVARERGLLQ